MDLLSSSRGREATVRDVQPYDVHGSPFVRLVLELDGAASLAEVRLGVEAVTGDPAPGDRVRLREVMGNVIGVDRL